MLWIRITYNLDSANFLHEECWDDVARQHSKTAQEADQVNENIVLLNNVQVAAMFVLLKGGILHFTVNKLLLPKVCREPDGIKHEMGHVESSWVICPWYTL